MNVVTAIVLYAVIWFMTLFVILPIRLTSQSEDGNVVQGTPGSAPANPQMRKRFLLTSAVAFVIWAIIATVIITGAVTVADFDMFTRFREASGQP